jgi:hypothetical protein
MIKILVGAKEYRSKTYFHKILLKSPFYGPPMPKVFFDLVFDREKFF